MSALVFKAGGIRGRVDWSKERERKEGRRSLRDLLLTIIFLTA
jgi:hypothetical protein